MERMVLALGIEVILHLTFVLFALTGDPDLTATALRRPSIVCTFGSRRWNSQSLLVELPNHLAPESGVLALLAPHAFRRFERN
jgi:hypothetical protein